MNKKYNIAVVGATGAVGQMMVRICMNDDKMPSLINIVRREKQREQYFLILTNKQTTMLMI